MQNIKGIAHFFGQRLMRHFFLLLILLLSQHLDACDCVLLIYSHKGMLRIFLKTRLKFPLQSGYIKGFRVELM